MDRTGTVRRALQLKFKEEIQETTQNKLHASTGRHQEEKKEQTGK
jgi:hypothetical protein